MTRQPTLVYEVANVHGGDVDALLSLVDALGAVGYEGQAVKFHPIAAETIALPDFSHYAVYEQIALPRETWRDVIAHARGVLGDVWLEVADLNAVTVLQDNHDGVAGLKLQASILGNHEVFHALAATDLTGKAVMLNVSGHELADISAVLERFRALSPRRLALQVGFQGYPTAIDDTLLNKLAVLRAAFPDVELAFSDHVDGDDPFARRVPLLAAALGCSVLEKHVCLDRATAPYDGSAALEPPEVVEIARELELTARCFSTRFIVPNESAYLAKTVQLPVVRRPLPAGSLVAPEDLFYRRTDQQGLTADEVSALQRRPSVLARDVAAHSTLGAGDFRPAHVAALVAGRMTSSRLPRKSLAPVAGRPSVDRCLDSCDRLPVRTVVFATSSSPEDDELAEHAAQRSHVWRGQEDDVIRRYLGACDEHDVDVVVRVTADCLVLSSEVTQILLDAHFASGADYTRARSETIGTAPQIFTTEALRRIDRLTGGAAHSEYMNMYVEQNPELFSICWVDLPPELVRPYRLTLDYAEDLALFDALYRRLDERSLPGGLREVFAVLDDHPDIAGLNAGIVPVYGDGGTLIERLRRLTRIDLAGTPG